MEQRECLENGLQNDQIFQNRTDSIRTCAMRELAFYAPFPNTFRMFYCVTTNDGFDMVRQVVAIR